MGGSPHLSRGMVRLPMRLISLAVVCVVACVAAACSTPAGSAATNTTGGGTDATVGQDGTADADGTAADGAPTTDTAAGETAGGPETAVVDLIGGDTPGPDAVSDGTDPGDTAPTEVKPDTTPPADVKPDVPPADVEPPPPPKCKGDSDCGKGFSECIGVQCDLASGKCLNKVAADGAACKLAGVCGGTGKCAKGACEITSACSLGACSPNPLKCGDKVVLDPTKLGASQLGAYPCLSGPMAGGEAVFALSAEGTATAQAATVELAAAGTEAALLILGPLVDGKCAPKSCIAAGNKIAVGLPVGVTQIIAVDTMVDAKAAITLTVTCGPKAACGDGQCNGTEACSSCPKDCGACPTCGDGQCDKAKENCGGCPADCGACPPVPTECQSQSKPGCAGCACEACVCAKDDFCCKTAWDSICVGECTKDCGGPTCPTTATPTWCGDGKCNTGENATTCMQDCPPSTVCGDGECTKDKEKCQTCPLDCGACAGGPATFCGNAKCDGLEHCGLCPADCGICKTDCSTPTTTTSSKPGCGGCACEAAVCAMDPFCCKTAWDNACVDECSSVDPACPQENCGDGVCSSGEDCESCSKDCGACVCGDGKCASSENGTTCPGDCPPGCKGKCGSSSKDAAGKTCWCDDFCEQQTPPDCCDDKKTFCPAKGG